MSRKEDYVSLNNLDRKMQKDDRDKFWLDLENEKRKALGRDLLTSVSNINETGTPKQKKVENLDGSEQDPIEKNVEETEISFEESDPFLLEAGNIVIDLISLHKHQYQKLQSNQFLAMKDVLSKITGDSQV